jgi:hypothetical protein
VGATVTLNLSQVIYPSTNSTQICHACPSNYCGPISTNNGASPYGITNWYFYGTPDNTNGYVEGFGKSVSITITNTNGYYGWGYIWLDSAEMPTNQPDCPCGCQDITTENTSYAFVAVSGMSVSGATWVTNVPCNTYVVGLSCSNFVTVTASPNPSIDDQFLPAGWNMTGGISTTNADGSTSRTTRLVDAGKVGITTVTSTSGTSSESVRIIVVFQITNQCVATSPTNQARTTIGVGEQVNLWLLDSPNGTFPWSTSAGSLSSTNGTSTTLTAPGTAQSVTVTVECSCRSTSLTFAVISPSGFLFTNGYAYGGASPPAQNWIGFDYHANVYVQPDSVNFGNISFYESGAVPITTGYYSSPPYPSQNHPPNGPHSVTSTVVPGLGTDNGIGDEIGGSATVPFSNGQFTWPIVWSHSVGNTSQVSVETINEMFTLTGSASTGTLQIQKGASGYTLSSPNSTPQPIQ